jgi:hypothetical protein
VRALAVGSPVDLGSWGYLYATLQVLGFALGGLAVYGHLRSLAYCERCAKYLTKKDWQTRYSAYAEKVAEVRAAMHQCVAAGHTQEAISIHAATAKKSTRRP